MGGAVLGDRGVMNLTLPDIYLVLSISMSSFSFLWRQAVTHIPSASQRQLTPRSHLP